MKVKRPTFDRAIFRTLEILRNRNIKRCDITQVSFGENQWTIKEFMHEIRLDENTLDQMHMRGQTTNSSLIINLFGYSKEDGWKTLEIIETRH